MCLIEFFGLNVGSVLYIFHLEINKHVYSM
jgi:hypothetical protein